MNVKIESNGPNDFHLKTESGEIVDLPVVGVALLMKPGACSLVLEIEALLLPTKIEGEAKIMVRQPGTDLPRAVKSITFEDGAVWSVNDPVTK